MADTDSQTNNIKLWWRIGIAFFIIILASIGASMQDVNPRPLQTKTWLKPWQFDNDSVEEVNAWLYPLETNALARMPFFAGEYKQVFSLDDDKHIWIVGEAGAILYSEDGGQHWQAQNSNTTETLWSIHFTPNGLQGWAVGDKGIILNTTDAGQNWYKQTSTTTERLSKVSFVSDGQQGWAIGDNGTVLHSNNAGYTWQQTQISGKKSALSSIQFDSKGLIANIVSSNGSILHTNDAGKNWDALYDGTNELFWSIHLSEDAKYGWAVGWNGSIFQTNNAGQSWQEQKNPTNLTLYSVNFTADNQQGWAAGSNGSIIHTENAGKTWHTQESGSNQAIWSIKFNTNGQKGWAVGAKGSILHTVNGGQTWLNLNRPVLTSTYFDPNSSQAWAVGWNGSILYTRNAGQDWQYQNSLTKMDLGSVHFSPDNLHGWVVGDSGIILYTNNAGQNWQKQNSSTKAWLNSVHFNTDGLRGWIVGDNGIILHTDNAGQDWQTQASGTNETLYSVHFTPDGLQGWAVGDNGIIIHTSNAGQDWQFQHSQTKNRLNSVHFSPNGQQGLAIGDAGTIVHTGNAGQDWQTQNSKTRDRLVSMYFSSDAQQGWVVGNNGTIVHSRNTGQEWQQDSGTKENLNTIQFATKNQTLWAFSSANSVLTSNDNGEHWQITNNKNSRWPAPWYYLCLILAIWLISGTPEWFKSQTKTEPIQTPDTPLQDSKADRLAVAPIAITLAKLLTYKDTRPPITIGITADWGRGKSSLMNMLRIELKNKEYPCVWFNAWHHQDEVSVFSSLLEEIRQKVIPNFFTITGLWFRIKLLWKRDGMPRILFSLSFLLILGLTYPVSNLKITFFNTNIQYASLIKQDFIDWHNELTGRQSKLVLTSTDIDKLCKDDAKKQAETAVFNAEECNLIHKTLTWQSPEQHNSKVESGCLYYTGLGSCIYEDIKQLEDNIDKVVNHPLTAKQKQAIKDSYSFLTAENKADKNHLLISSNHLVNLLLSCISIIVLCLIYIEITVLGENRLLSFFKPFTNSINVDLSSLEAVGQRKLYEQRFAHLLKCFNPNKSLVIFIDDLDRCSKDYAVKVLEVTNFITTNERNCYFVLGFYPEYLKACVGLNFSDIAIEMNKQVIIPKTANMTENEWKREIFARRYLQKLINVEAPLPEPLSQDLSRMLQDKVKIQSTQRSNMLNHFIQKLDFLPTPTTIALLILLTSVFLLEPERHADALFLVQNNIKTIAPPPLQTTTLDIKPTEPNQAKVISNSNSQIPPPAIGQNDSNTQSSDLMLGFIAVLLVGTFNILLRRQPQIFSKYPRLISWLKLELQLEDNPGFNNALDIWHNVILKKTSSPRELNAFKNRARYFVTLGAEYMQPPETINESHWIALAAIHYVEPDLLNCNALLNTKPYNTDWTTVTTTMTPEEIKRRSEVEYEIKSAIASLQNWPPTTTDLHLFRWLAKGMKI